MVIDVDEYVYATQPGATIGSVLGGLAADVTQLQLQPKNFGSSAERAQPASVVQGFTLRASLGKAEERRHLVRPGPFGVRVGQFGAFWSAKSIVRTRCLLHFEVRQRQCRGATDSR